METKRLTAILLIAVICLGVLAGCSEDINPADFDFTPEPTSGSAGGESDAAEAAPHGYSVSCSSDIATDVAMAVLKNGGNAVDAAVALSYTLAVVEHYASGLGGSGGLLVYDSRTGECEYYDYRARSGSDGYSSIAVPGFVKGMEAVHNDYGTVSMNKLLQPAVSYAADGFKINGALAYRIETSSATLAGNSAFCDDNGNLLGEGAKLVQRELADTLRLIQEQGSDAFYKGAIAEDLAKSTSLTMDDLEHYKVNKSKAIEGSFNGYTVYGAGAPLSGVVLIQMLEMAQILDIPDPDTDPDGYLSDLSRITGLAYSDRYYTITDPDFYDSGTNAQEYVQSLVADKYVRGLLGEGDSGAAGYDHEKPETTSYSIVDSNGLVVSSTNTLSGFWGSQLAVDGFFLNNTNYNFSSRGINAYEPNKRSRTFTAPTIVTGSDGYVLSVGSPGGNNIPSVLFNVLVDILKFGEDPQTAVTKSRFLYRDGTLTVETDRDGSTWLDLSSVNGPYVWHDTGYWWGSVSLAGYSDRTGAFAAFDYRRGATKAGVFEPDKQKKVEMK